MRSEAERMIEECQAEYQTILASVAARHMADPDSELRRDFDRELEPWREKWDEVLDLETAIRREL